MCTVSIIPLPRPASFRVVVNRDELRTRPPANPPVWRDVAGPSRRAIYPVDPKGGGTWVAASPCGIVFALLNVNLTPTPELPRDLISRGAIIPSLIGSTAFTELRPALERMDLERYAPFRLVAIDTAHVTNDTVQPFMAYWDRNELRITHDVTPAACYVSSGLGDEIVKDRLPLFDELVRGGERTPEAQDTYHAHIWPDRTHQSVLMSRPDARTVSITRINVETMPDAPTNVAMEYLPIEEAAGVSMPVRKAAVVTGD